VTAMKSFFLGDNEVRGLFDTIDNTTGLSFFFSFVFMFFFSLCSFAANMFDFLSYENSLGLFWGLLDPFFLNLPWGYLLIFVGWFFWAIFFFIQIPCLGCGRIQVCATCVLCVYLRYVIHI
jgi:hypothetical protein